MIEVDIIIRHFVIVPEDRLRKVKGSRPLLVVIVQDHLVFEFQLERNLVVMAYLPQVRRVFLDLFRNKESPFLGQGIEILSVRFSYIEVAKEDVGDILFFLSF